MVPTLYQVLVVEVTRRWNPDNLLTWVPAYTCSFMSRYRPFLRRSTVFMGTMGKTVSVLIFPRIIVFIKHKKVNTLCRTPKSHTNNKETMY